MPRFRIEVECDEDQLETVIADGRWKAEKVETVRVNSKPVCLVTVKDPDTGNPVGVEIRKLESGPMVGIDASFLEQLDGDPMEDGPLSPYDPDTLIVVLDDEMDEDGGRSFDLTDWPFTLDSSEFQDMLDQMRKFTPPPDEDE